MMVLVVALLAVAPQLPLSVATTDDALAVFANPAGLGLGRGAELYYLYNLQSSYFWHNHALAASAGPLGAFWEPGSRWGVALGAGKGGVYSGLRVSRDTLTRLDLGAMWRLGRWVSLGAVWNDLGHDWGTVSAGVGVRPLGDRLTLTADVQSTSVGRPGVSLSLPVLGLEVEPVNGLALAGHVRPDDWSFGAGVMFGLGNAGLGGAWSRVGGRDQAGLALRLGQDRRRGLLPRPRRYLDMRLGGQVSDTRPGFSLTGSGPTRTTWDLLDLVNRATRDRQVRAILVRLDEPQMSLAHAQELRAALQQFRADGRKVVAYSQSYGMGSYYVASVADKVIVHPMGGVVIPGVSATTMFLKGTLEKLGIVFEPTRHGKYKSAVEMFSEDSLTPANREQMQALVDAAYEEFCSGVASGRGCSRGRVDTLVDIGIYRAGEARAAGLVDTCCYDDELDSIVRREFRGLGRLAEKQLAGVTEFRYSWQDRPRVAVVYASGDIATGESRTDFLTGGQTMGASTIVRALRKARQDKSVKAIVLRVDSPGGDGFASDLIWREVVLAGRKKPVAVSMAGVAASGGYYISCPAEMVFCLPGTITGSIGVFSYKFMTEGLYGKLGINRETVKRGAHADMSDARLMTPEEDSMIQAEIDAFYDQFIRKVAEGRDLAVEQVDSVGQGRVWAGADALKAGLVDSLGGFMAAVEWAKKKAGLKECDYVFYPEPKSGMGGMMERMMQAALPEVRLWR